MKRTCQNCYSFDVCMKLQQACKSIVFTMAGTPLTLIDALAQGCALYMPLNKRTNRNRNIHPTLL